MRIARAAQSSRRKRLERNLPFDSSLTRGSSSQQRKPKGNQLKVFRWEQFRNGPDLVSVQCAAPLVRGRLSVYKLLRSVLVFSLKSGSFTLDKSCMGLYIVREHQDHLTVVSDI